MRNVINEETPLQSNYKVDASHPIYNTVCFYFFKMKRVTLFIVFVVLIANIAIIEGGELNYIKTTVYLIIFVFHYLGGGKCSAEEEQKCILKCEKKGEPGDCDNNTKECKCGSGLKIGGKAAAGGSQGAPPKVATFCPKKPAECNKYCKPKLGVCMGKRCTCK